MRFWKGAAIELNTDDSGGVLAMDDWAKKWAGKLRKREEDSRITDAKFVEQQKLKKEFGPPLWAELCEQVNAKCEALNKELHNQVLMFELTRQGEMIVITSLHSKRKELRVAFNQETGTLSW